MPFILRPVYSMFIVIWLSIHYMLYGSVDNGFGSFLGDAFCYHNLIVSLIFINFFLFKFADGFNYTIKFFSFWGFFLALVENCNFFSNFFIYCILLFVDLCTFFYLRIFAKFIFPPGIFKFCIFW